MFRHLFFLGFKLKASLRKRRANVRQKNAGIGRKEKHQDISFKLLKCLRRKKKTTDRELEPPHTWCKHTGLPVVRIWICFYTFSSLFILPQFQESQAPVEPLDGIFPFAFGNHIDTGFLSMGSVHTKCGTNQPHTDSGSTPLDLL